MAYYKGAKATAENRMKGRFCDVPTCTVMFQATLMLLNMTSHHRNLMHAYQLQLDIEKVIAVCSMLQCKICTDMILCLTSDCMEWTDCVFL